MKKGLRRRIGGIERGWSKKGGGWSKRIGGIEKESIFDLYLFIRKK
jgi:hypothetical protein